MHRSPVWVHVDSNSQLGLLLCGFRQVTHALEPHPSHLPRGDTHSIGSTGLGRLEGSHGYEALGSTWLRVPQYMLTIVCYSRARNSESESGWVLLTRSHGYSWVPDIASAGSRAEPSAQGVCEVLLPLRTD